MTCIIAIKEDNRIWLGADSCLTSSHQVTVGRPKIIKKGEFLLGGAGSLRTLQLFQYSTPLLDIIEGEDIYHYLINTVTHQMRQTLKTHGNIEKDKKEQTRNEFIIAFRGEIYKIGCDFAINNPVENYTAIGSGEKFALGSLHATELSGLDPRTRITQALDAASKYNSFVAPPYEILSMEWQGVEDGDRYVFYDSDGELHWDTLNNCVVEEELETEDGDTSTD